MRSIDRHIVHCSVSADSTTVDDIRSWHLERGFNDIGYHFVIYKDGSIHEGRPIEIAGAHCKGLNSDSVGTCLIGDEAFTPQQLASLQNLHDLLKILYNVNMSIDGHRKFTTLKTCPNFEVKQFIKE